MYFYMKKYKKLEICDKPKTYIKVTKPTLDIDYGLYTKNYLDFLKDKIKNGKSNIKEDIKYMLLGLGMGTVLTAVFPTFVTLGLFGVRYLATTALSSLVSIVGLNFLITTIMFEMPDLISDLRDRHIYKKNLKKLKKLEKKGLLKEYLISPTNKKGRIDKSTLLNESCIPSLNKKEEKTEGDKLSEAPKSDMAVEKPKKREIKYKETLITVENGKEVRKEIIKTTMHSPRYEDYKEHMIRNGAAPELFELEAINDIIDYVIEYGDPVVMAEGRSPIYFNTPNIDGTFDICGRMGGYTVSLVYKMQYCFDGDPEHYIKLTKYKMNDGKIQKYDEGNDEIFINKEGNIVSGEIDVKSVNKKRFIIRKDTLINNREEY